MLESVVVTTVLLITLAFLASNRFQSSLVLIVSLSSLTLIGILNYEQALSGFTNSVLIIIAFLYVVMSGLKETGAMQMIANRLIGYAASDSRVMNRVLLPSAAISSLVNNNPVVAFMTVTVQNWCQRNNSNPSKYLLPLSYISILGGTCTLIGTSTNLVVNEQLIQLGDHTGFALFELSWVGVPLVVISFFYLKYVSPIVLKRNVSSSEQFKNTREYLVEMELDARSDMVGRTIREAGLRNLPGLFVIELQRNKKVYPVIHPEMALEAKDRLVFAGSVDSIAGLKGFNGLNLINDQSFKLEGNKSDRRLFEAVISPINSIVGKSIKEARFRHRYNAVVLSVSRHGKKLKGRLGDIKIQSGDTMLIEAQKGFLFKYRNNREFLLVGKIGNSVPLRTEKAPIAIFIMIAFIALVVSGLLDIVKASMLAAGAMLITKCTSFEEARKSIDYEVLVVIACALGLGLAVKQAGLSNEIAGFLISAVSGDPYLSLMSIFLCTMILTELITNNAAAIVMLPIGYGVATSVSANPEPFAIAIMIAASASFLTPIGYQTNLMVMGPGGYRFSDYVKLGLPLSVLTAVISLSVIPIVWPL